LVAATLLRALESRRYRPVGSDEERPFDVRVVAATNRDLETAVSERSFRQDLLFRINAITIRIPALRDRVGDVALLAETFLVRAGARTSLSPAALAALAAYAWPGNVRELEHQMQRLASLGAARIELEHLPRPLRVAPRRTAAVIALAEERAPTSGRAQPTPEAQRDEITRALEATTGNISRAAERLGLTRHGLKKRMLRLGMRAARSAEPKE
jgi:two-component system response regulator HydG